MDGASLNLYPFENLPEFKTIWNKWAGTRFQHALTSVLQPKPFGFVAAQLSSVLEAFRR